MRIYKVLALVLGFSLASTLLSAQVNESFRAVNTELETAMELFEKQQYGNAQLLFDKLGKDLSLSNETRMNAHYYASVCAIELYRGDIKERVEEFARIYETSPLRNRLWLRYANNLFSLKRYRQAIDYYEKVDYYSLSDKAHAELQFKLAYSYLQNENAREAEALFFKLKDGESAYASSARYYYAHLRYSAEDYSKALTNFLPLQEDPNFGPLVPYYLAHIYYALEDYDKLVEVGEDLIQTASPSRAPEIAKLLADAFYQREDYSNTLKYVELYQAKGGKMRLQDHYQAGYSYYQEQHYPQAIAAFNKISAGPEDIRQNAYYHLADAYLKVGERNQALVAFKAASDLDENQKITEDAYYNYAKLSYEMASPFRDVIQIFKDYLRQYPNSRHKKKVNEYLANIYITSKDYDKAMDAIKVAGLDSPEMRAVFQKIAFYRATELFNSGALKGALDRFQQSAQYPEDKALATLSLYWQGECQYRLEDYPAAERSLEQFRAGTGAAAQEVYNRSFYNSAYIAYKQFDFQKAAGLFRAFSRDADPSDPRLSDAYLRLGDAYLLTGGYLLANDFYSKAIQAGIKDVDYAYFQKAECYGLEGKAPKKVEQLQQLYTKFPESPYAERSLYEIALTQLQMEDYPAALKAFSAYENAYPQSDRRPEIGLKRGLIFSNQDQNQKAIDQYKFVVDNYPGTKESIEAVRLAEINYKRMQNIDAYLDWVATIDFIDYEESQLDSTAYAAAFDVYAAADYQQAVPGFQSYLRRFPRGIFLEPALYYAAQSAVRIQSDSLAYHFYENLIPIATLEHRAEALAYTAKKDLNDSSFVKALQRFERLNALAQSNEQSLVAQQGALKAAWALRDSIKADSYAALILKRSDLDRNSQKSPLRIKALIALGSEQWSRAMSLYDKLLSISDGSLKAESYYYQALILQKQAFHDSSNSKINIMIEELPSYREWKLKALYLMAYNFWKLDDIFQANYILDFILESEADADLKAKAQALKDEIAEAEEQALAQKERLLKEQSMPIILDAEGQLQILDFPANEEPLEDPEIIEK